MITERSLRSVIISAHAACQQEAISRMSTVSDVSTDCIEADATQKVSKDEPSLNQVKQASRGCLRKEFLQLMSAMVDRKITVHLMEGSDPVIGTLKGFEPSLNHLLITKLETRIGVHPDVLIRLNDVTSYSFDTS